MTSPRSAFGARERADLALLHDQIQASPNRDQINATASELADRLRRDLPDLDSVTLGRVLLVIDSALAEFAMKAKEGLARPGVPHLGPTALIDVFETTSKAAALQLTEAEWRDGL